MKRIIALLISLVMCLSVFGGCASQATTDEGTVTEVTIWHTSADQQDLALNEIADAFNNSQSEIKVIVQSQPSSGFVDSVYSAVANGVGPDIIFNYATTAADFVEGEKVADLGKYFDLDVLKESVSQVAWDECNSFIDGKMHCVPLHSSGPVLFYNKTLYEELDLQIPTTWDELTANSKAIYDAKGIPGFAADSLTDLMQCRILQSGSGYIDTQALEIQFNNQKTADILQWFADNVNAGYFALDTSGDYGYIDFNAGLVGSYIGSSGSVPYLEDTNFEYGITQLPQGGEQNWYPAWNRALIVFSSTPERERAACEFIKFFTNPENSAKWCIASGSISPYLATAEIAEYQEYLTNNEALNVVSTSVGYATGLPSISGTYAVRVQLEMMAALAVAGEQSIQEILNSAATVCNDSLQGK